MRHRWRSSAGRPCKRPVWSSAWETDPQIERVAGADQPGTAAAAAPSGRRAIRPDGPHPVELLAAPLPRASPGGHRPRLLRVVLVIPACALLPAVIVARLLGKPVVMNYRSGEAPDHSKRSAGRARRPPACRPEHRAISFPPRTSSAVSGSTPRSSRTSSSGCALRFRERDAAGSKGAVHPQLREPLQPPMHLACVPKVPGCGTRCDTNAGGRRHPGASDTRFRLPGACA